MWTVAAYWLTRSLSRLVWLEIWKQPGTQQMNWVLLQALR